MDYAKFTAKRYPRVQGQDDAETRYWKRFSNHVLMKEFAPISSIAFCPVSPHDFAATTAARIQIYSPKTNAVKRTLSRFQAPAHGVHYRSDGRLMSAGDESGLVQIFDLSSRAILRQFQGHQSTVRGTRFLQNNTQVVSCSDDRSVRVWDIPSSSAVHCWQEEHTDYVRSCATSAVHPHLMVTGSYDHTVKVWDLRTDGGAVMTLQHEAPVEAVLMFRGDSLILSAAGNQLLTWDILGGSGGCASSAGGGRLVNVAMNHQKTITSLCFDGQQSRVFTGSLDHHVKIYDIRDYHVTHSIKYSAPVLAVGVSPDDTHIAVAMSNGLLSIREKAITQEPASTTSHPNRFALLAAPAAPTSRHEKEMLATGGTRVHFQRGTHKPPAASDMQPAAADGTKPKTKRFERLLRQFRYAAAVDAALTEGLPPATVVALFEELMVRGDGLVIALSGRDDEALEPVLKFVMRYMVHPNYVEVLSEVLECVLDIYGDVLSLSPVLTGVIKKIQQKTHAEVSFQVELQKMLGVLDMYVNFAEVDRSR